MNRLVIIGNGFDLAHGLKTSYKDFIDWYWEKKSDKFYEKSVRVINDILCSLTVNNEGDFSSWSDFAFHNSMFRNYDGTRKCTGLELYQAIKSYSFSSILNFSQDLTLEISPNVGAFLFNFEFFFLMIYSLS